MHVNRKKKVYRLMKVANLIKSRKVRRYIARRTVTIPDGPNHVWEQDITYVWCGNNGGCYLFNIIIDCYTREWIAYTFSVECGTDEAINTLEKAIMDRFPDGDIADRSDSKERWRVPVHITQVYQNIEYIWHKS